jgi:hypothetical protein
MAGEVKAAAEALETALRTVEGLRVFRDPGGAVDPPAAILGAPALTWETTCLEPTGAQFMIHVVVVANERALEQLWDLVPVVTTALDGVVDASVIRADPGTYPTGGKELPAYLIQVDVSL